MKSKSYLKAWWKAAAVRAVKTMAQSAVAAIGTAAFLGDVNWFGVASTSVLAGFMSVLTSVGGLPEVTQRWEDSKAA